MNEFTTTPIITVQNEQIRITRERNPSRSDSINTLFNVYPPEYQSKVISNRTCLLPKLRIVDRRYDEGTEVACNFFNRSNQFFFPSPPLFSLFSLFIPFPSCPPRVIVLSCTYVFMMDIAPLCVCVCRHTYVYTYLLCGNGVEGMDKRFFFVVAATSRARSGPDCIGASRTDQGGLMKGR